MYGNQVLSEPIRTKSQTIEALRDTKAYLKTSYSTIIRFKHFCLKLAVLMYESKEWNTIKSNNMYDLGIIIYNKSIYICIQALLPGKY